MKLNRLTAVFVTGAILLWGCDDFLDENPNKTISVVPETVEDFEALLNNYEAFGKENAYEIIYPTDDFALSTDLIDGFPNAMDLSNVQHATWDVDLIANEASSFWTQEWGKIFKANLILNGLPDAGGDAGRKGLLEAEAHFIRAYSFLQLTNAFCLPYSETNMGEPGLPLKQTVSFEEPLARSTLGETWAFMEADLQKALELSEPFDQANGFNKIWRANTAAVNGFAARFYLAKHDYAKAQEHAQNALDEYSTLRNYNTDMRFSLIPREVTIPEPEPVNVRIDFPFTYDLQLLADDKFAWGESYYYKYLENRFFNYYPSQELLGLYDPTYDLRFKFHIVEDYTYIRGAINPPYSYPGYIFFSDDDILSGPSVPEMLLIKAECQVRQGNWGEGLQTANQLRQARIDSNAPMEVKNLTASSATEALTKVLEERRREMPFVHRWYDLRRYNNNNEPSDDVAISRMFYPYSVADILRSETPVRYTLEKDSRRYARPIPTIEVVSSNGVLLQNEY